MNPALTRRREFMVRLLSLGQKITKGTFTMKRFVCMAALAAAAVPAFAADVGVSINIDQPGLYGRIDIGNLPQPQLLYARPVLIQPPPMAVVQQPIDLHVPPGHAKHWRKHCAEYNACGQPVYFVHDDWYNNVYAARYRDDGHRGYRDDDRREERHGHDRGRGHGRGDD